MKFFLLSDLTKFVLSMAMHECYPGWNYVGTKGDHGPLFPKLLIYIYIFIVKIKNFNSLASQNILYSPPKKKKNFMELKKSTKIIVSHKNNEIINRLYKL